MDRDPEEFKQKAEEHNITHWPIRDCSICGYQLKYIFKENKVLFDRGCHCTTRPNQVEEETWQDVANHYNMQDNEDVVERMNEFWHFQN